MHTVYEISREMRIFQFCGHDVDHRMNWISVKYCNNFLIYLHTFSIFYYF